MRDSTREDKEKYRKDFPDQGSFNWKVVKITTAHYDGHKTTGVVLHDGKFMINGVLFEANEFEIIGDMPQY